MGSNFFFCDLVKNPNFVVLLWKLWKKLLKPVFSLKE